VPTQQAAALTDQLRSYPGVSLLPIYQAPSSTSDKVQVGPPPGPDGPEFGPPTTIIDCASLAALPVLGQCTPGVRLVKTNALEVLLTDNVANINKSLPVVTAKSSPVTDEVSTLYLSAVLVRVSDPATLERIRTLLSTSYQGQTGGLHTAPQTFGEVASVRAAIYLAVQNAVLLVVILTLIAAAASLAIAVTGSIVERKRPFTLLRVSGTTTPTLYRVVLLESVVPLLAATLVAVATGLAVALPVGRALTGGSPLTALPDGGYYLTLVAGLLVSLGVLVATMPIIRRVTVPAGVRFE
jgi:FtsX-like permease family